MENAVKSKWLVDVSLFVGFLMAFFLDLTGIELHQWIGLGVGALASYHLAAHWAWVCRVTERIVGKTSSQARLYYLLDLLIFTGFLWIGLTGLVISSWLNLTLSNFDLWLSVHIWASIITLLLTVLKVGIHGRWVVAAAKKVFATADPQATGGAPVLARKRAPALARRQQASRGEFLKLMGLVGAASFIAFFNAASGLQEKSAGANDEAEAAASQLSQASSDSSLTSSLLETTSSQEVCLVQCNRRCSYPGHCRRYTDGNGNGRCDLGECG